MRHDSFKQSIHFFTDPFSKCIEIFTNQRLAYDSTMHVQFRHFYAPAPAMHNPLDSSLFRWLDLNVNPQIHRSNDLVVHITVCKDWHARCGVLLWRAPQL